MSTEEVNKFNNLFDELLEKMITKFDNNKLRSYRKFFLMIKTSSPRSPANLFMTSCINYKDQIRDRDDEFFMNDPEINEKSKYFGNFTADCGITEYWNKLSKQTQKAIWDYVQSLYVLAEIIVNKNKDMFDKYNSMYLKDFKEELSDINNSKKLIDKLNS